MKKTMRRVRSLATSARARGIRVWGVAATVAILGQMPFGKVTLGSIASGPVQANPPNSPKAEPQGHPGRSGSQTAVPMPETGKGPSKWSVALYGGPSIPTGLTEMVRLKNIRFDPTVVSVVAGNFRFKEFEAGVGLELDWHLAKHWDQGFGGPWSAGGAFVFRWLKTPWSRLLGRGSMGFGNGLSYATSIPETESRELARSSQWLWHLVFEMSFGLGRLVEPLDLFLRLHHRSGVFGLFGNVTGGSDYLCLGLRATFPR